MRTDHLDRHTRALPPSGACRSVSSCSRSRAVKPPSSQPTEVELQILRILWELRLEPATFRALHGRCDSMSTSVLTQRETPAVRAVIGSGPLQRRDRALLELSDEELVKALGADVVVPRGDDFAREDR